MEDANCIGRKLIAHFQNNQYQSLISLRAVVKSATATRRARSIHIVIRITENVPAIQMWLETGAASAPRDTTISIPGKDARRVTAMSMEPLTVVSLADMTASASANQDVGDYNVTNVRPGSTEIRHLDATVS